MKNRPTVKIELSASDNPLTVFMHSILRPVLKQKNDILCAVIRNNKMLDINSISGKAEIDNTVLLKQFFQKNAPLRNTLIGICIGAFTVEELEFYLENQKELNRRILEMSITRFLSQFEMD